ncbi:MAG: ribonuclease J, partial [Streptococcus hyovaginalis]
RNLAAHADMALETGMLPENIYIMKRGDIMHLSEQGFLHEGAVSAGDVMIDGNAIGEVGNIVLRDRKVLSEDGVFIVAMTVNKKERKIVSRAKINTRGFVYVKKSRDILRESADLVNTTVENYLAEDGFDWNELKGQVRDEIGKFLFEQTKRRPAILPVIMEVR